MAVSECWQKLSQGHFHLPATSIQLFPLFHSFCTTLTIEASEVFYLTLNTCTLHILRVRSGKVYMKSIPKQ